MQSVASALKVSYQKSLPIAKYSFSRFKSTTATKNYTSWKKLKVASTICATSFVGYTFYSMYEHHHPVLKPLDHDPNKKTIVVLGSGWGSTSFIKDIDSTLYNVIVVSPRNYFLFTPLLPSCTVGTLDFRSLVEPIRYITRHKSAIVKVLEAECTKIDSENNRITVTDNSKVKDEHATITVDYDYLIVGVGAQSQTFGIQGVNEYACFLKEVWDAQRIRSNLMDCIETAAFSGTSEKEVERLLHMVVVGGGPTGIEYAAELHDFLVDDLSTWYPELVDKIKITLVEAMPNVLSAFSKQLVDYTESTFKDQSIVIHTKTMVKEVKEKEIMVQRPDGELESIPYGLLVWATGNTSLPVIKNLMSQHPEIQTARRGLVVDEWMRMKGTSNIYALGDCTATKYAPTAQVAAQQGKYLAQIFSQLYSVEQYQNQIRKTDDENKKSKLQRRLQRVKDIQPFQYSHQGSLCYVGSDKAIADLPLGTNNLSSGGAATYAFWRSAYISNLFSTRNRWLVVTDWAKKTFWGRDISRE